jgi:hypothetical protein
LRRQVDELQRTASGLQLFSNDSAAPSSVASRLHAAIAALARARIDGVWIEHSISGIDGTLDLRGTAAEAELLRLSRQPGQQAALKRRGISDLAIETRLSPAPRAGRQFPHQPGRRGRGAAMNLRMALQLPRLPDLRQRLATARTRTRRCSLLRWCWHCLPGTTRCCSGWTALALREQRIVGSC